MKEETIKEADCARIAFVKGFENQSYFSEDELFLIATYITDDARALGAEGLPGKLYITCCDIDRIYISADPEATPESDPDYIIRTWDYHICEEDPERVHIDSTFHILKDCSDMSGRCSDEHFDGNYDILVYGEIAKLRVAVLKGLTAIQIPDGVTVIPKNAFAGCQNLIEVHIPEGVTTIEYAAFSNCESLSTINLPNSLTEISFYAFWYCTGLQRIFIPDSVVDIGSDAFRGCDALTEISIPLMNIAELGLREDTHVCLRTEGGERSIPDGVTIIRAKSFKNCSEIKSIHIPDSVTLIGWDAFRGCSGLQEVFIPDSVMTIGENAFKDCNNLTEISIPLGLNIASAGMEESTKIVIRNNDGIRVLPEGVTEIPKSAFKDCTELKRVDIPDSVTKIGGWAFSGCSGLTEIHIPDSVTKIGHHAFSGCNGLSRLSVSHENAVYDSRDNCNAIIETGTGKIIAECENTILPDSWFQSICDIYGFIGSDEPDEELRVLTILKNNFDSIDENDDLDDLSDSIKQYIASKYRREWYKNYIGTRKLVFDGPFNCTEGDEITEDLIKSFMQYRNMVEFTNYRLQVGHTERQDRLTTLMRDYPSEVLDWLDDAIPYGFFTRIAQGGNYELFGNEKDEFLDECGGYESDMSFEYASVLEEVFGIDYAVDYLSELEYYCWLSNGVSAGTESYIITMLYKAVKLNDNEKVLRDIAYTFAALDLHDFDDNEQSDLSVEMLSRLAAMWSKGLITDEWLTDDYHGLAGIFDFEWGDDYWEEEFYPEIPDECRSSIWLLKLLESDFAYDIADYLKPLLEMVLEKEKNHNWETGKKAIESFLHKTSNK